MFWHKLKHKPVVVVVVVVAHLLVGLVVPKLFYKIINNKILHYYYLPAGWFAALVGSLAEVADPKLIYNKINFKYLYLLILELLQWYLSLIWIYLKIINNNNFK